MTIDQIACELMNGANTDVLAEQEGEDRVQEAILYLEEWI
jgi:hypothetical protein